MVPCDSKPLLIEGGLHVDIRGTVAFVNDFNFDDVNRSYVIRSHQRDKARGWVGHRREKKWFWAIQGAILIAMLKPDQWDCPSRQLPVERHVLSANKPQVLFVPAGYATASIALSDDAVLMVFSSGTIDKAKDDDFRFAEDTWPIIEI